MRQEHLAMMSVPKQKWKPITGPAQALRQGTVFEDLNLPFFVTADQSEGQNSPLDDQLRDSIMANLEKSGQQNRQACGCDHGHDCRAQRSESAV